MIELSCNEAKLWEGLKRSRELVRKFSEQINTEPPLRQRIERLRQMSKENPSRAEQASQRIQDAGVMSKAIADEFVKRHPEAIEVALDPENGTRLRLALAELVAPQPEAELADEPDTDVILDEDFNG